MRARIKADEECRFTPLPESHGCKAVDEWLSGAGFRPTGGRNPEEKGATGVSPWGSTRIKKQNVDKRKREIKEKIGIIGFGNMGSAIAERIKKKCPIYIFDRDPNKVKNVFGMTVSDSIDDLINRVDIIILAVKPQDFTTVLNTILDKSKNCIKEKLIISIAAGVTTRYIETCLGKVRLIRVMPNMPASIGEGISALSRGRFAKDKDLKLTEAIFQTLGETLRIDEKFLDSVTAISGSGPAYFFYFLESLIKAAVGLGLKEEVAKKLVIQTALGSAKIAKGIKEDLAALRKRVTSKGGTTQKALDVFEESKLAKVVQRAVLAAAKRAGELSRKVS